MHVLAILAADDGNNAGGGLIQIGILLLIPLAMYFLMIRPQRRRMREQQAMQSSLEVGDEVITASGIYGFITGFEEDIVWVEIDDDVQVRVSRASLQGKARVTAAATTGDTSDAGPTDGSTPAVSAGAAKRITPSVKGRKPTGTTGSAGATKAGGSAETTETATEAGTDAGERTTQE